MSSNMCCWFILLSPCPVKSNHGMSAGCRYSVCLCAHLRFALFRGRGGVGTAFAERAFATTPFAAPEHTIDIGVVVDRLVFLKENPGSHAF